MGAAANEIERSTKTPRIQQAEKTPEKSPVKQRRQSANKTAALAQLKKS